jgi:hypothetical protein
MIAEQATRSVITVGDGRGFVIESPWRRNRLVVTAAHCLPSFPPAHAAAYTEEITYPNLLGPLGAEPTVWAECVFVDPIADIALLGSPDDQELYDEAEAYGQLTNDNLDDGGSEEGSPALLMADAPERVRAWVLSLEGKWLECEARHINSPRAPFWLEKAAAPIAGGMSGSPILADDGSAIGVVCVSSSHEGHTSGGPNPRLAAHLPSWLAREVRP